jgi:hypothetical protein
MMKTLIKIEELLLALLAFYLFLTLGYAWWLFLILFLVPDVSMIGYLLNPRVGAWTYNIVHHKGMAIALFILGDYLQLSGLQAAGLILLGHSSLDRVMDYGLKYADAFQHTHLGKISRAVAQ